MEISFNADLFVIGWAAEVRERIARNTYLFERYVFEEWIDIGGES